jgi:hypothetical protein
MGLCRSYLDKDVPSFGHRFKVFRCEGYDLSLCRGNGKGKKDEQGGARELHHGQLVIYFGWRFGV